MKKIIRFIVVLLIIIFFCFFGGKLVDSIQYSYAKSSSLTYLCKKYNAQKNDFELLDYNKPHKYWKEKNVFFLESVRVDYSLEYRYKDRKFIVARHNKVFYDDYQFEDVENWCTKWFKENIDSRICGFEFYEDNMLRYLTNSFNGYDYVIKESDTSEFLKNCFDEEECPVFYYCDVNGELNNKDEKKLGNKIKSKLSLTQSCIATYSEGKNVHIYIDKYNEDNWEKFVTLM